jgi:hypothetical protein
MLLLPTICSTMYSDLACGVFAGMNTILAFPASG